MPLKEAETFDDAEYMKRHMINSILEVEETQNHQMHCRFIKPANMCWFG
jgi:hypothetical protein